MIEYEQARSARRCVSEGLWAAVTRGFTAVWQNSLFTCRSRTWCPDSPARLCQHRTLQSCSSLTWWRRSGSLRRSCGHCADSIRSTWVQDFGLWPDTCTADDITSHSAGQLAHVSMLTGYTKIICAQKQHLTKLCFFWVEVFSGFLLAAVWGSRSGFEGSN